MGFETFNDFRPLFISFTLLGIFAVILQAIGVFSVFLPGHQASVFAQLAILSLFYRQSPPISG